MTAPSDYPDRAEWPRYWRNIRRGAVICAVILFAGIVVAATELAVAEHPWRLVFVVLGAGLVAVASDRLIDRAATWIERRFGPDR